MLKHNKKIMIIGPVKPYRGGIAQHTSMLNQTLSVDYECLTISFSRQYPRWLYPGKSDRECDGVEEPGVEYILDSINPLTWQQVYRRIVNFAPTLVVFPWWHVYWVGSFGWLAGRLRKSGIAVVFICHNVIAHENSAWQHILTRFALFRANRFLVHTYEDKQNLLKIIPTASVEVHPLPIFEQFPPSGNRLTRSAKLELLFFGFVRPYKGLDIFIDSLSLLQNRDIHVSIVGEFWEGEDDVRRQIETAGLSEQIDIVSIYVSDAEAAEYFSRCDAVILPYRSATGSAVIPLAYLYGKPVIATRVGGLPDVIVEGMSGLLVEPESPAALAHAITDLYDGRFVPDVQEIEKLKNQMSWSSYAKAVIGCD